MTRITPEERRAKYPLPLVTPLDDTEIEELEARAREWVERPTFSERSLDRSYHTYLRLIATIRAARPTRFNPEDCQPDAYGYGETPR